MKNLDISHLVLLGSFALLLLWMLTEACRNRKTPAHKAALRRQRQIRREMLAKHEERIAQDMEQQLKESRRREQVAPPPVKPPLTTHDLLQASLREIAEFKYRRIRQTLREKELLSRFKPSSS